MKWVVLCKEWYSRLEPLQIVPLSGDEGHNIIAIKLMVSSYFQYNTKSMIIYQSQYQGNEGMPQTITLTLPDELYEPVYRTAQTIARPLESMLMIRVFKTWQRK